MLRGAEGGGRMGRRKAALGRTFDTGGYVERRGAINKTDELYSRTREGRDLSIIKLRMKAGRRQ